MKFGTKLQYDCPDKCPKNCKLRSGPIDQGSICIRCPVFCCPDLICYDDYRDDWAAEWDKFFKTGEVPVLCL